MVTATDIRHGTAVAAVNKDDKIRVFWQAQNGDIQESVYDGGWKYAPSGTPAGGKKLGTPIAACSEDLNRINLFSLDYYNRVTSSVYDAGTNTWSPAWMNEAAAPYTKIGATYLPGSSDQIRVYFQLTDNTIQEVFWSGTSWAAGGNLGQALPGTSIGVTSSAGLGSGQGIRLYVQHDNGDIVQKCWNVGRGWWSMDHVVESGAPSGCAITATHLVASGNIHLRVYWTNHNTDFWQWCYDSHANHPKKKMTGHTIQGTDLAAVCWPGTEVRVYYQGGTNAFGLTEWQWGKSNTSDVGGTGKNPLPPA